MWGDKRVFKGDPFAWLLESDDENPGVRLFALRELFEMAESDPAVVAARTEVMNRGPVPKILENQNDDGSWLKSGAGYTPKYKATIWQVYFLAELGADPAQPGVRLGCEYVLEHARASNHAFSFGDPPAPSKAIVCLNGNMLWALAQLGYGEDERYKQSLRWLASAVVGGPEHDFIRSGTSGPVCECSANGRQPCGWGAAKVLRALTAIPVDQRSPTVQRAADTCAEFLLSHGPETASYPYTGRVSSTWFKYGFPLSYWSDVLEVVHVVAMAGHGADARLQSAIDAVISKQDDRARWAMENSLNEKMWVDIEAKGKPSKWVTLRALRALKLAAHGIPE